MISVVGCPFSEPVYMSASVILMEDKSYLNQEVTSIVSVEDRRAAIDEETLLKLTGQVTSSVFLDELIDQLVWPATERDRRCAARQERKYPHVSTDELVRRRCGG